MKHRSRNTSGFSLVEVTIATVVLATFGVILLQGIASQQALSRKVTDNSQALNSLATAAEMIAAAPFTPCGDSAATANPYAVVAAQFPPDITIDGTYAMAQNKTWMPCGQTNDQWSKAPAIMQRVVLRAKTSRAQGTREVTRTVLKTFSGRYAAYNPAYQVAITGAAVDSGKIRMGPIVDPYNAAASPNLVITQQQVALTARTSAGLTSPLASTTCYYLFPRSGSGITAQLPANPCGSSVTATFTLTMAPGNVGTQLFEFGAYDPVSGNVATPATLTVIARPPIRVLSSLFRAGSLIPDGVTCTGLKSAPCVLSLRKVADTGTSGLLAVSLSSTPVATTLFLVTQTATANGIDIEFKPKASPTTTDLCGRVQNGAPQSTVVTVTMWDSGYTASRPSPSTLLVSITC